MKLHRNTESPLAFLVFYRFQFLVTYKNTLRSEQKRVKIMKIKNKIVKSKMSTKSPRTSSSFLKNLYFGPKYKFFKKEEEVLGLNVLSYRSQCPRIHLNQRSLPRPTTTTAWKLIPHRSKISKDGNPPQWVPLHRFFKNWFLLIQNQLYNDYVQTHFT